MPIVLERFKKSITINKQFAQSLVEELQSDPRKEGTIRLIASEILLDPSYEFNYNNTDVNFPGRYDLILVADHFDSQGRRIDLTGSSGHVGADGTNGANAPDNHDEPGAPGEIGETGGRAGEGGIGSDGMNIKIFCGELVDGELISNGGAGGRGGNGGNGGNGGKIKSSFLKAPTGIFNTNSSGGGRGSRGEPGINALGVRGPQGSDGNLGTSSTPDMKRLKSKELWEKIIIELGLPSG